MLFLLDVELLELLHKRQSRDVGLLVRGEGSLGMQDWLLLQGRPVDSVYKASSSQLYLRPLKLSSEALIVLYRSFNFLLA